MSLEIVTPIPGKNPILLLDIDGVFTVLTDKNLPPELKPHPKPLFKYNPDHGPAITELTQQVLPIYISDWQAQSHEHIGAVHTWPRFNWIDSFKYSASPDDRRRVAASHLLAHHPLAWIDDELTEADYAWAHERTEHGTPTLLIKPNARIGLRESELARVHQWLGGLAADAGSGS